MKRPPELVMITRREVCGGLAACLGAAAIAGCGGDSSGTAADAPMPDTGGGACATGATDVGAPSTFTTGKPVYFSTGSFFVVRDAMGLYALTARCTHEGAITVAQTADFYCPRHGAMFDFNGTVTRGPATVALQHYAMCVLANGHIGVNTTMTVAQSVRLNA
jgi:nitrite reductase/ring-hydroxylating ferredoxin subunit